MRIARHRGEQVCAAFLRRGRGLLAEALRHLGRLIARQPDQIALLDHRCQVDGRVHPVGVPGDPRRLDRAISRATFGLDAEVLETTVAEFNAAVVPAPSTRRRWTTAAPKASTPPKTHWARRIDTPPFFAYPLRPGITFTYLGVAVDEGAHAVRGRQRLPDVFAAGEIMAGNILGKGYLAGFGMTIGTVFGRIAGEEAARMPAAERAAARCADRGGAAPDDDLQCLPLLRGLLRCVSRRWSAGSCSTRRPELPRQPLLQLRRLLLRLPVRAAARVRDQLPALLAEVRTRAYKQYAWPRPGAAFDRNGAVVAIVTFVPRVLPALHRPGMPIPRAFSRLPDAQGSFYAVLPHGVMAGSSAPCSRSCSSPRDGFARFWPEGASRGEFVQPARSAARRTRRRSSISTAAATAARIRTDGPHSRGAASIISRSTASCCASRPLSLRRSITTRSAGRRRIALYQRAGAARHARRARPASPGRSASAAHAPARPRARRPRQAGMDVGSSAPLLTSVTGLAPPRVSRDAGHGRAPRLPSGCGDGTFPHAAVREVRARALPTCRARALSRRAAPPLPAIGSE